MAELFTTRIYSKCQSIGGTDDPQWNIPPAYRSSRLELGLAGFQRLLPFLDSQHDPPTQAETCQVIINPVASPCLNTPSLKALQQGDPSAWDDLFDWLWPTAESVARLKLSRLYPEDVEDVAIQALETLVEKVLGVKTVEELKPLTAAIAHNLAVSLLREKFAKKRGSGKIESLDATDEDDNPHVQVASPEVFLKQRYHDELKGLLVKLKKDLKPEYRHVLNDFFKAKLTYLEISQKRGIPIGSVGVYLKRGLEALRETARQQPGLMRELEAFAR